MIVAGILGGVAIIALAAFYFIRRERQKPNRDPEDVYPHW
jgi:hypothetical protein